MAMALRERIESVRCGSWPAKEDFEQQLRTARRAVRDVRHASEDALADASVRIRRHPLRAVGGAAALGLVFGTAFGVAAGVLALRLRGARS